MACCLGGLRGLSGGLAIVATLSSAEKNEAYLSSSVAFWEPKIAPGLAAGVQGWLACGNVRSVRPTALDWDARSSAVKLFSALRPIRIAGPELFPLLEATSFAEEPDKGAECRTDDG